MQVLIAKYLIIALREISANEFKLYLTANNKYFKLLIILKLFQFESLYIKIKRNFKNEINFLSWY